MTCHDLELELGGYVDGTLAGRDVAPVEAHLRHCPSCRAVVDDLRALRTAARSLEPLAPPAFLWPRIAAAVEEDGRRSAIRRLFRAPSRAGVPFGGWQPTFATAVVVVLLGSAVWVSWRSVTGDMSSATAARRATPDVLPAIDPAEDQIQAAEQHYTRVIASLEQIAQTDRTTLDTPVAAMVDQNLAVIDEAIGESREALKKEPTSELAQDSLFEALRSKVTLLQETVALINEMRKGNQEGAARIMSGMNQ